VAIRLKQGVKFLFWATLLLAGILGVLVWTLILVALRG